MTNLRRRTFNYLICALFVWNGACAQEASSNHKDVIQPIMPTKCDANEYELAQCLSKASAEEEVKYEEVRAKVRSELRGAQVQAFDQLDVEWKRYRQTSCEFDSARAGGSSQTAIANGCVLSYTQGRVRMLSKYLVCITTGDCGNGVRLYMIELGLLSADK